MKKKALIIGGAGFIGINTARHFMQHGWEVTVLDNLSRKGTDINLKWLSQSFKDAHTFIKADVRFDQKILAQEVERHDAVIHLAAQVAVTTSVIDPRTDFDINLLGTFNVLETIRNSTRKPPLVYASTNKVYGDLESLAIAEKPKRYFFKDLPCGISETQPLDFHSPYGCSKGGADQYVRDYARIYGLRTAVLRQSCIYGFNQFGVEDQGWIAWFVIAALLKKSVTVYGNGKQVRDALFVDDLTDLYFKVISKIETAQGKIYNVGGGNQNSISLLEFLALLQNKYGLEMTCDFAAVRPGDQKIFISDNTKLFNDFNWQPRISIKKGLDLFIGWVKENWDSVRSLY